MKRAVERFLVEEDCFYTWKYCINSNNGLDGQQHRLLVEDVTFDENNRLCDGIEALNIVLGPVCAVAEILPI